MSNRGLILGGGGVTGIAWMTGLLLGLSEAGFDALIATRIVGTSAGSTVGAQITSAASLQELFQRQVDPALQAAELEPPSHLRKNVSHTLPALMHVENLAARMRRIGDLALQTSTVDEATRRASIADRLPAHEWPEWPLATVAVDTASGDVKVFDRSSGVSLIDAVAASCAVPGLWPPVTLGGKRYMDGSVASSDNVDLLPDCDTLLVISPLGAKTSSLPGGGLHSQVDARNCQNLRTYVIEPDGSAEEAMGQDPFDAGKRAPTAKAGYVQGRSLGGSVTDFWSW